MTIQLSKLASMVGGHVIGDDTLQCHGANPLGVACDKDITLLDDPARAQSLSVSPAIGVVTPTQLNGVNQTQIVVSDPHQAFTTIVAHFRPPVAVKLPHAGIDESARVDSTAQVHSSAIVGSGVVVGAGSVVMPGAVIFPNCKIGDDCVVHSNVTLYPYTELGDRVVIHAGSVIGANGFGYRQVKGKHVPTAQLGYVILQDDVEVGACVTIDRGTYGATVVGEGTKIDNQVQIGHNCRIGRHNLLCSQVGIAGSCSTGDYVVMAGQVGLKDHIHLEDNVIVGAKAGVMADCKQGETYLGAPATVQREQMQIMAVQRKLPEMRKELKRLRSEIDNLTSIKTSKDQTSDQSKAA